MSIIKNLIRNSLCYYFYFTRNRKNQIVYFEAKNKKYSDNQKAISEALAKIAPDIQQVWHGVSTDFPNNIAVVNKKIDVLKAMAQSRVWVIDLSYCWKPKSILNIATWHGDRGFKKILFDVPVENTAFRIKDVREINGMDLFLSGSDFGDNLARTSMRYNGEIQTLGCPRNDKLVNLKDNQEYIKEIKQRLNIPIEVKILLYAPTFRDNTLKNKQKVDLDITKTIEILQHDGSEWICLVRAHSISKGLALNFSNKIRNTTNYPDMADLLLVSDLLVTDYSSCCCDYILTEKPCVLLQTDQEQYITESRQFSVIPEKTGFLIAKSEEDFYSIISQLYSFDHKLIAKQVKDFYGTKETGMSSVATANRIYNWINNNGR